MVTDTDTDLDADTTRDIAVAGWKLEFRKLWASSATSNLGDGVVLAVAAAGGVADQ